MLPDFPATKADVEKAVFKRIRVLENEQHPILAGIKTFTQYEGRSLTFEQVDFGMKTQDAQEHGVPVTVRFDEVPTLFGLALDQKLRGIAQETGALKVKSLLARIEEATEQTGQRFDAGGQPPSGKMLLDFIGSGEWGFDKAGKSRMSFLMHPDSVPGMKKAADEVENDPELKQRHESIVSRQREQWLDRESCRKLVD